MLTHDDWVDYQVATGGRVSPYDFTRAAKRLGIPMVTGVEDPQLSYRNWRSSVRLHLRGILEGPRHIDGRLTAKVRVRIMRHVCALYPALSLTFHQAGKAVVIAPALATSAV